MLEKWLKLDSKLPPNVLKTVTRNLSQLIAHGQTGTSNMSDMKKRGRQCAGR